MTDKKKNQKKTVKKSDSKKVNYTLARTDDGTIQINFLVPYTLVDEKRELALKEIGKELTVPGFRKGKAPLTKVAEHVNQDTVIQKTLGQILPEEVGRVIREEKLRPAIYPKFELTKALDNEPWEIRATTCELPEVKLGDYKKKIRDVAKSGSIWTPEKGDPKNAPQEKPEEKAQNEQKIIQALLEAVDVRIPKLLIDEEVNAKLSQLLDRIEKLGLNLDSYLASIGKNPQTIRSEYEAQAKSTIALDLILTEIAKEEKITVSDKEIDTALEASKVDSDMSKKAENPDQKRIITSILTRRKALESVLSLSSIA